MPDIVIVNHPELVAFGTDEAADVRYSCDVYAGQTSEQGPYNFTVDLPRGTLAAAVNAALIDAAVTACAVREITVGLLDKKTLVGGAS
jgi:hypothetical protein